MHQQSRNNTRMRLIVEQGIAQDYTHGSVAAWRFMSSHGVPEPLILRVLSNPDQRRASDAVNQRAHHPDTAMPPMPAHLQAGAT